MQAVPEGCTVMGVGEETPNRQEGGRMILLFMAVAMLITWDMTR